MRFLRHWAIGSAAALVLAAFVWSAYAFPGLWGETLLAFAYRVRYLFVMGTALAFGGTVSQGAFFLKALFAVLLLGLLPALVGTLLPRRRP